MEEYRTPLGDSLTASLFNLGVLNENDFHEVTFSSEDVEFPLEAEDDTEANITFQKKKGVLLTREGLRKVITHFEKRLDTRLFYPPLQKPLSYRQIISQQIRQFKRVINGEESLYKPLVIK